MSTVHTLSFSRVPNAAATPLDGLGKGKGDTSGQEVRDRVAISWLKIDFKVLLGGQIQFMFSITLRTMLVKG